MPNHNSESNGEFPDDSSLNSDADGENTDPDIDLEVEILSSEDIDSAPVAPPPSPDFAPSFFRARRAVHPFRKTCQNDSGLKSGRA